MNHRLAGSLALCAGSTFLMRHFLWTKRIGPLWMIMKSASGQSLYPAPNTSVLGAISLPQIATSRFLFDQGKTEVIR
jgi:hypothetical protein